MSKTVSGAAHIFASDDIDTDLIIPAKYLNTSDATELSQHALESLLENSKSLMNSIIVTGANFGCGSSREHAVWALAGAGVQAVIAESFARIFFRNSINFGLLAIQLPEASKKISAGDKLEIDTAKNIIKNLTKNKEYAYEPLPEFLEKIVTAGGLLSTLR